MGLGIFTVIEGIDGSGKGTQTKLLAPYLKSKERPVFSRHYPTYESTELGSTILEMLQEETVLVHKPTYKQHTSDAIPLEIWCNQDHFLELGKHSLSPMVLQALFAVDRYQVDTENRRMLRAGHHLVFDRYYQSSVVYGQASGIDTKWLKSINSSLLQPDVAILLDTNPEVSNIRRPGRRDSFEKDFQLLEQVAFNYRQYWDLFCHSGKYHIVDANQSVDAVHHQIVKIWEEAIKRQ